MRLMHDYFLFYCRNTIREVVIGSIGCSVLQAICDNSGNAGKRESVVGMLSSDSSIAEITRIGDVQAGWERAEGRCEKMGGNAVFSCCECGVLDSAFTVENVKCAKREDQSRRAGAVSAIDGALDVVNLGTG